uniref:PiggyBac transposable element-derived protein domain-containing protein n=1 Tax=Bactrocera latifrons TaxID=174628 RepID=A0A0K8UPB5_BACLA
MSQRKRKLSIEEIHQIINSDAEDIFDESDSDEDFVPITENETDDSNTSSSESEVDVGFEGSNATEEVNLPNILSKDKSIIWHDQPLPISRGETPRNQILCRSSGSSKCAISMVTDVKSSFDIFMPSSIKNRVVEMSNIKE